MSEIHEKVFETLVFEPLAHCAVLDSRIPSRRQLARDLKSSSLFKQIYEAPAMLERGELRTPFDACILGPSLSLKSSQDFLIRAGDWLKEHRCAVIAVVSNPKELTDGGIAHAIHEIISRPYSAHEFRQGVVKGVARANIEGPWHNKLQSAFGEGLLNFLGAKGIFSADGKAGFLAGELARLGQRMRMTAARVDRGEFKLRTNGELSDRSRGVIEELAQSVIAGTPDQLSADAQVFYLYMRNALYVWFARLYEASERDATRGFRESILRFQLVQGDRDSDASPTSESVSSSPA